MEMTPEEIERLSKKFSEDLNRIPKQYIYYLTIKDCKRLQQHGQLYHGDYWDLWCDPEARSLGSLNEFAEYVNKMNSQK